MSTCPVSEADVAAADRSRVSEIVECGDCHSELEVMTLDPVNPVPPGVYPSVVVELM